MLRTAFDIGGTFTDFVTIDDEHGIVDTGKVPTQPEALANGVLGGLDRLIPDLREIAFAVHGTTVGINAFIQRKGGRVLLVVTRGTRDVYHIARGHRLTMYDARYRKPQPLVPLHEIAEVGGRLAYSGEELEPLDEQEAQAVVQRLQSEDFDAVAVAFLFSYLNPAHEVRLGDLVREAVPDLPVALSHRVAPEWQEYERTSSAVIDAYIGSTVRSYLTQLQAQIHERGMQGALHVMQSNGGIITARGASERPLQTLLSGPVGGVMGATEVAGALDRANLICADMGGTSFDVSLVVDGRPDVSPALDLEGLPVLMPAVMIHTIGAGGGSLGFVEAGGLRVGPASAGANPGPVCYGRGGEQPTVTDANLLLGRVDPEYFLGGEMTLDVAAAEDALTRLGLALGLEPVPLAQGMITVVNAKMAQAIRTLTVERGIEPRDFSLLAYGGAGPMHAAFIADELEIPEVIVPWSPGTFSAWGMLQAPLRHDLSRMFYRSATGLDGEDLEEIYGELETEGREQLEQEGAAPEEMVFRRSMGLRYAGQEHTVEVWLEGATLRSDHVAEEIGSLFHAAHHARYGHSTPDAPFECVVLRVAALGEVAGRKRRSLADGQRYEENHQLRVERSRPVVFDGAPVETQVVLRSELEPGNTIEGPVIVEEPTATTVVPPSFSLRADPSGWLVLRSSE